MIKAFFCNVGYSDFMQVKTKWFWVEKKPILEIVSMQIMKFDTFSDLFCINEDPYKAQAHLVLYTRVSITSCLLSNLKLTFELEAFWKKSKAEGSLKTEKKVDRYHYYNWI